MRRSHALAVWAIFTIGASHAQETVSRDELMAADYKQGRAAFQQRCSACHTLIENGANLNGPNLWKVFGSQAGIRSDFAFSDALKDAGFDWSADKLHEWISNPDEFLPGNNMMIPEAVPENDRIALIAFAMLETGAADWPRPEVEENPMTRDKSKPLSERFPSFFNHLMNNTTRYRLEWGDEDYVFQAYFNADGSIGSNIETIRGFWRPRSDDFFCYALYGLPIELDEFVECFPMAAMSIPRFAEELWQSSPANGVKLYGGIMAGRPSQANRSRP